LEAVLIRLAQHQIGVQLQDLQKANRFFAKQIFLFKKIRLSTEGPFQTSQ
jgi:hypothetical protein